MLILLSCVGIALSTLVFDFSSEEDNEDDENHYADENVASESTEIEDLRTQPEPEELASYDEPEELDFSDEPEELDFSEDQVLSGVEVQLDVASGIAHLISNEADHLVGGAGNDTIVLGEQDSGEGGIGRDTFIIGESAEDSVPTILDFEVDKDLIEISLPSPEDLLTETWPVRPEFNGEIEISFDDSNTYIWVDEKLACKLEGLHELSTDDIEVKYDFYTDLSTDFDQRYDN